MAERQIYLSGRIFQSENMCIYTCRCTRASHIYMGLSIEINAKHLPEMDLSMQNLEHPLQLLSVCGFLCLPEGNKDIQQLHGGCSHCHHCTQLWEMLASHSFCLEWWENQFQTERAGGEGIRWNVTDRETASSNAQPSEKAEEHRNSKTSPFLF